MSGGPTDLQRREPVVMRVTDDAQTSPSDLTALLRLGLEKDVSADALEKIVNLHVIVSDRAAKAEFSAALARFKQECPIIPKRSQAKIVGRAGGSFTFKYADLPTIVTIVDPLLFKNDLSYTWDCDEAPDKIVVICKLRHANGHMETSRFSCPVESSSGVSNQQKSAAAMSYGRRVSLCNVLGITTADTERDGSDQKPITKEQTEELRREAKRVGADEKAFLGYLGVESFEEITTGDLDAAKNALQQKARSNEKRKAPA